MKIQLLLTAAGLGTRLGEACPKALVQLHNKPLIIHALERFVPLGLVENAIITAPPEHLQNFIKTIEPFFDSAHMKIVPGGLERQDSVYQGLRALHPDTKIVVIHDAARPFVAQEAIQSSIDAAIEFGAATVAIPSIDTILQADQNDFLVNTPDRSLLWACQTPQTFQVDIIHEAHQWAMETEFTGTDDATLVRAMGNPVKLVKGSPLNYKITTPEDRLIAELLIEKNLL